MSNYIHSICMVPALVKVRYSVADLEFLKGGFQYGIKARVALLLGGSGGMPPLPRKILNS